ALSGSGRTHHCQRFTRLKFEINAAQHRKRTASRRVVFGKLAHSQGHVGIGPQPEAGCRISRMPDGIATGSMPRSGRMRQQQATILPAAMAIPSLVNSNPYVIDFSPTRSTLTLISTMS